MIFAKEKRLRFLCVLPLVVEKCPEIVLKFYFVPLGPL